MMLVLARSFRAAALVCLGLSVVLSGCGTGEYNRLMNRRLGTLRAGVKFKNLYGPTQISGTPISIRVPMIYSNSYEESSPHKDDGAVISPDRVQPPFLKLPGFKMCYEGTVTQDNLKLPHYIYLAALPSQAGDADKLAAQLQTELKNAFSKPDNAKGDDAAQAPPEQQAAEPTWEQVDVDTPRGGVFSHWRKIRVEGDQMFRVKNSGKIEEQRLPGVFELWLHDANNYLVLVGWRTPKSIEGQSAAPTQFNGLVVPPTDAKLDLTEMPARTAGTVTNDTAPGTASD
jgi:hypothetical protein